MPIEITGTHYVRGAFTPYRAVGLPGQPYIKTRTEHKDQLRRFGREEIGNDPDYAPPEPHISAAEWSAAQARKSADIERSVRETAAIVDKVAGPL